MRGLRTDMPGFTFVTLELANAVPLVGATAGVPQDVYDHFVMCNQTVDGVDERLAVARKLVEVLEETRAFYIDARQNDLSLIVDAIKSRAQRRKDSKVLLQFERTLEYVRQIGDKAAPSALARNDPGLLAQMDPLDLHALSGENPSILSG